MLKVVINIPCYNEEKTLPLVLQDIPTKIEGVTEIEIQVVDDGSTDRTAEVAEKHGCTVIQHKTNRGLGRAFKTGVMHALEKDVDIFVNTDADNQYPSKYIEKLVKPVLDGESDIVIGNRRPWNVSHFSKTKRFFQKLGNFVARNIADVNVPDTVSGFRAYSKEALLKLHVTTKFSYVLDTLVQASDKDLKITNTDIDINPPTRPSRLFSNIFQHMYKSGMNLCRLYALYKPFKTFLSLSIITATPGLILITRFFYFYFQGMGDGYIQSLIIASILMVIAGIMLALGIIGEIQRHNRQLIEEELYLNKKERYD